MRNSAIFEDPAEFDEVNCWVFNEHPGEFLPITSKFLGRFLENSFQNLGKLTVL